MGAFSCVFRDTDAHFLPPFWVYGDAVIKPMLGGVIEYRLSVIGYEYKAHVVMLV